MVDEGLKQEIRELLGRSAKKDELRRMLAKVAGIEPDESGTTGSRSEYSQCVSVFLAEYESVTGIKYSFTGRDGKALKELMSKLKSAAKPGAGSVVDNFGFLIRHLPEWYRKNAYSLTVINNNFNVIVNLIRGEYGKQQQITDYEQRTARDCFGIR